MPVRILLNPTIPDHEVLRKIGGGAYGEVWLARGVTGALRAVKVVWREDFEDERGFEREFEGILKFEPISRDHPGLVNILHVGRSPDSVSFYYYVMELGDDVRTGREINPIEYEPRTLRADNQHAVFTQWNIHDCIEVGLRLAEALEHLHEQGLAHRDIKPSNIIFVNGKAKLADIGLVAARGQRTFVGTEGFVPPEGPGSAQADVYSLGKVLYEIATGKDRMNFPELPEEIPGGADRKRWLELNRVICDICEPRISKRKITTAGELAASLRRIHLGKRRRRGGLAVWLTTLMLTGFSCWVGWQAIKDDEWVQRWTSGPLAPTPAVGLLRVFSIPEGADVIDSNGVRIDTTPTQSMTARVGERVSFTLRKKGYLPMTVEGNVTRNAIKEPMPLFGELQVFSPPIEGEAWQDHLGESYQPVDDHHVSAGFVTSKIWESFSSHAKLPSDAAESLQYSQNGEPVTIMLTKPATAKIFCEWLRTNAIKSGFLTEDHEVSALREMSFENPALSDDARANGLRPFRVMIRKIVYGKLQIASDPPGADVYVNGQREGVAKTLLTLANVKPGTVDLLLVLEGYKPLTKSININEGQLYEETLTLEKNQGVVFGSPWENGINMNFAPIGQDLMASIWETRVCDYALFIEETQHPAPLPPPFLQEPDHPVINVSRDDAMAFCNWLSERERNGERIARSHVYRLPTDLEWSHIVGLPEEIGISPGARDVRKPRIFPWGTSWSDGEKYGNFADRALALTPGVSLERTLPGYHDGFAHTAPVGSFKPNQAGVCDLSGNVQEWVADDYSAVSGSFVLGVLRGGGWNTYQIENLYTGSRNAMPPTSQDVIYGFRVVLAKIPPAAK